MSLANPVGLVLSRLADAQPNGDGWKARCPAHDDRQPSLSIGEGDDGRALLNCFAGCSTESIVAAIGLTTADLFSRDSRTKHQFPTDKRKSSGKGRASIVATYDYRDADGTVLYQVCRMQPKDFRQRQPDGKGGWNWSTKGVRKVLYRLPELMAAGLTRAVAIVEGEKDADRLATLNIVATTNAGGAGKWLPEYNEFLRGRPVVLLPDNDDAGRRHADAVAIALHGIASSIRVVDLPGLPDKGDVSDWLDASGTCEQLAKLTKSTPYWTPPLSWPDLEPLGPPSLPPFPSHVLPTVLREWIEAEAEATQTPADLPGLLALAVCSAAIARKIEVAVRDSWREPVNLYVAVLLEPANRKSAVFSDATNPLRTAERESIEQNRSRIARESAQRRQAENRLRSLEKKAASKDDESVRNEAIAQAEALADWPEPVLPRLIVDDSTSEKLGIVLAEQDGRIASMSPEGGVFDLMAGLYSKSGMPQFGVYLMGHAGDDLRVDRVSRPTLFIRRPAITMALAIQPAVIEGLADKSAFRGRGLLARFLYAAPKSRIGERDSDPPAMPNDVRRDYDATVKRLIELEPPQPSDDSDIVGADLTLTVAAKLRLKEFLDEIEADLADCGRMETMRDWGGKLAGATIRLAAILHCVTHADLEPWATPIDLATLESAIEIACYLKPHADAVLTLMKAKDEDGLENARYVWRWIVRHGRDGFTKRDLHRATQRRFPKADNLDAPLGELFKRGYIRESAKQKQSGAGRPASPQYEVNPLALESEIVKTQAPKPLTELTESGELPVRANSVTSVSAIAATQNSNESAEWGEV